MMKSMQSAVTGLRAQQTAMDVIANNIANSNTVGFKASSTTFSDLFYQTLNNGSEFVDPSQVGYGAQVAGVSKNMTNSGYTSTDDSTDLFIDGGGYFALATSQDATTANYYTRVGNFTFKGGYLVDRTTGAFVMARNTDGSLSALRIDSSAGAAVTLVPQSGTAVAINDTTTTNYPNGSFAALTGITVNQDGTVSASLGSTSGKLCGPDGKPIQIALCQFQNDGGLTQVGNNFYSASESSGPAVVGAAGTNNTTVLRTGALESSNVDIAKEFTNMITSQRGFQADSRVITVSDSMLEELVNLKRQ